MRLQRNGWLQQDRLYERKRRKRDESEPCVYVGVWVYIDQPTQGR